MKKAWIAGLLAIPAALAMLTGCGDARAEDASAQFLSYAERLQCPGTPEEAAGSLLLADGTTLAESGTWQTSGGTGSLYLFQGADGAEVRLQMSLRANSEVWQSCWLTMTPGALRGELPFGITGADSLEDALGKMGFSASDLLPGDGQMLFFNLNGETRCEVLGSFSELPKAGRTISYVQRKSEGAFCAVELHFSGTGEADSRLDTVTVVWGDGSAGLGSFGVPDWETADPSAE